jgi:hypothetical protein
MVLVYDSEYISAFHNYLGMYIDILSQMSKTTNIDPSQWALNTITNRYVAVGGTAWKRGMKAGIIADNNKPPIAVEKKIRTVAKVDHLDTSERDQLYQQLKTLRLKDKLDEARRHIPQDNGKVSTVSRAIPRPSIGTKVFGGRPSGLISRAKLARPKPRIKVSDMTESEPPSESDILDL